MLKTENMMAKNTANELINEKSPYLLQHAYNPVHWHAWNDEAFQKAKRENKPIFLSIGYSTCHWCHVMEKESFEDLGVAELLNNNFVSIKVDREERPDIDNIYMSVCQMLTGGGGWPLTIVMTPDQKPFFAGTYFPKSSRRNRIGMMDLIPQLTEAWQNRTDEIFKSAGEITEHLSNEIRPVQNEISEEIIEKAFIAFQENYDPDFGGFGNRPKFPSPHNLLFLLRNYHSKKDKKSLEMVRKTLTEMRKGGIYDHIGYGFHRYSTDEKWFLPHFEKMLYDQAMLIMAYTEAFQVTHIEFFRKTAEEIAEYVRRDMTSEIGGFFSAEDADSEGEEGKYYLWNKKEIEDILGVQAASIFTDLYAFEKTGNYYEEATGNRNGNNIPYLKYDFKDFIERNNWDEKDLIEKIEKSRNKIFEERKKRIPPLKDDKILTDWNGLMIAALAKAGRALGNKQYIELAEKCIDFIRKSLFNSEGDLLHRYRDGESAISAKLDDYSFLIWGLLEIYEADYKVEYLELSVQLTETVINEFWDHKNNSGFYFTAESDSNLITRTKEFYDGAIPSGNSVMYLNLLKLNKFTGDNKFLETAESLGLTFQSVVERAPTAYSFFLSALTFYFGPSKEIIITGNKASNKTKKIISFIGEKFMPNLITIHLDESTQREAGKISGYLNNFEIPDNDTIVYICKNFNCELPINDIEQLKKNLE